MAESSKKKTGFYLPREVHDAFEELASRVTGKEKWQVISAAILLMRDAPEGVQNDYIRRVRDASGPGGSFRDLLTRDDPDVDVVGELGKHAADATRQRGRDRPPGRAARR